MWLKTFPCPSNPFVSPTHSFAQPIPLPNPFLCPTHSFAQPIPIPNFPAHPKKEETHSPKNRTPEAIARYWRNGKQIQHAPLPGRKRKKFLLPWEQSNSKVKNRTSKIE